MRLNCSDSRWVIIEHAPTLCEMTWILILREGMLLMSSSSPVEEVDFFLAGDPFTFPPPPPACGDPCCPPPPWPPHGLPGWPPTPTDPPLAGDPGEGWLTCDIIEILDQF